MKILIDMLRRWVIGDLIGSLVMMILIILTGPQVTLQRSEVIAVLVMSGFIGLYSALFRYLDIAFYQLFVLHFVLTVTTVILTNRYFDAIKLTVHFEIGYTLLIYFIIWIGMWWWERDDRRRINNQIKKRQRTD
ncbi:DUF3021 domain-containing protein [Weissella confusa]|uniref:DUF3021 family protein n=1 Tax=Weissella fermenti TaxID=2987699 RepID=A0ABT6D6Q0_9LACO|nr:MULTISPECIES: DUF3021 family protein [Weissella]MBJ7689051.1 DUF3021 domain-containing protein [Weissella confusa]MCW0925908.1 DUF3021 domain-containing protein [Weissella sp. LMG 11983]MDF9300766.1 DUF3021 family protein [Weissella sp. BK2]